MSAFCKPEMQIKTRSLQWHAFTNCSQDMELSDGYIVSTILTSDFMQTKRKFQLPKNQVSFVVCVSRSESIKFGDNGTIACTFGLSKHFSRREYTTRRPTRFAYVFALDSRLSIYLIIFEIFSLFCNTYAHSNQPRLLLKCNPCVFLSL